jgi:hypothetical protein
LTDFNSNLSNEPDEPLLRGDRAFTYRVTFLCLAIGVGLSAVVGIILLSLRQPITATGGSITWSPGAFMVPLAGFLSAAILALSVFYLPVVVARRTGFVLDPQVWPAAGAIAIGILVVIGFVGAILLGVI